MADTQDKPAEKCYDKYGRVISEEEYARLVDQHNEDYARLVDPYNEDFRCFKNTPDALVREEIAHPPAKKPVPKKKPVMPKPIGGYQNESGKSISLSEYMRMPKIIRARIFEESILEGRQWTSVEVSIDDKVFWSDGPLNVHAVSMKKITSIFAKEYTPRVIDLEFMLSDGQRIGYYVYNKTAEKIVDYFKDYLLRGADPTEKADPTQ